MILNIEKLVSTCNVHVMIIIINWHSGNHQRIMAGFSMPIYLMNRDPTTKMITTKLTKIIILHRSGLLCISIGVSYHLETRIHDSYRIHSLSHLISHAQVETSFSM